MKQFIKDTGHYFGFASFFIILVCCGLYCFKMQKNFAAVESGFFFQGQKYVEFRNGEKMGLTSAELKDELSSKGRVPSSFKYGDNGNEIIYYQKMSGVTCFYTANDKEQMQSISCIK